MAIDRLRSPYNNLLVVTGDVGPSAFASIQVGGVAPYTFIGDGSANTIVGVTYRVHRFDYNATSQSLTFSQAGNVDILVAAGGGAGGGSTTGGPGGAGGGGAGGLILMYSYGVTATTYNVTVGKGGYDTDGLGGFYYTNAVVNAQDSVFGALTAIKGGYGAPAYSTYSSSTGGSGGGAGQGNGSAGYIGSSGTAGQGNAGGNLIGPTYYVPSYAGAGGGSYVEKGGDMTSIGAGKGGDGLLLKFDGTLRGYCAGGGGGSYSTYPAGAGGANGGGSGKGGGNSNNVEGAATSYGSGGGGGASTVASTRGGAGYNGVVIVRYALG